MKVAFIMPSVGKKPGEAYVKTWQMEPLVVAVLSAITPNNVRREFYDDRMEKLPAELDADIVAITVETYTARRAYQISAKYRKQGKTVVLGGFHPTLMPDEAARHADAVVIGEAEESWPKLIQDYENNSLKKRYHSPVRPSLKGLKPDREIYGGRNYSKITLVELGRGCRFSCEFCSISSFFQRSYSSRSVEDVIDELKTLDASRIIFFVDDNIAADMKNTRHLLEAMKSLNLRWVGQISVNAARDESFLCLMKASGCLGVLIGFESIVPENLQTMDKGVNCSAGDYEASLAVFRRQGLAIYATFVFGYDLDTPDTFRHTYKFVQKHRFFFTAFNHLVPFPGTPLYRRLAGEKRLIHDKWWLKKDYRFGDVAFRPKGLTSREVSDLCFRYRKKMYSLLSILKRGLDIKCNCNTLFLATTFFLLNFLSGKDVDRRQGLPLGEIEE